MYIALIGGGDGLCGSLIWWVVVCWVLWVFRFSGGLAIVLVVLGLFWLVNFGFISSFFFFCFLF